MQENLNHIALNTCSQRNTAQLTTVGLELFLTVKSWTDLEVSNVGIGASRFVTLIFLILRKRLDNLLNQPC